MDAWVKQEFEKYAPEEEVLLATKCEHGSGNKGWLVATNHQMWWFERGLLGIQIKHEEISYRSEVSVGKAHLIKNVSSLDIGNRRFQMKKEESQKWAQFIRSQRDKPRQTAAAAQPAAKASLADELKKLAELRDVGVLSEDEFAAQKAQLLGAT